MNIAWLKQRRNESSGYDPLGLQSISEKLYSALLPGVRNQTLRLRYYAFYPWLLLKIKDAGLEADLQKYLRRGEYLFGIITHDHDHISMRRSSHMVGSRYMATALKKLKSCGLLKLSDYTDFDSASGEKLYFGNEDGGLAAYYIGALGELGILTFDDEYKLHPRGKALAEAFDPPEWASVFLDCVIKGVVEKSQLEELKPAFSASMIAYGSAEHRQLVECLIGEDSLLEKDSGYRRRETLRLMVLMMKHQGLPFNAWDLLNLLFYRVNKKGEPFLEPVEYKEAAELWRYYVRHEYFSIGLLAIFFRIQLLINRVTVSEHELGSVCWDSLTQSKPTAAWSPTMKSLHAFLKCDPKLEEVLVWLNANRTVKDPWNEQALSEYQLAQRVMKRHCPEDELMMAGFALVLMGCADPSSEPRQAFGEVLFDNLMQRRRVNLRSLHNDAETRFKGQKISAVVTDLIDRYIVKTHYQVAMTKLSSKPTFRFYREHGDLLPTGIKDKRVPMTSPRLTPALRFLADLGLAIETRNTFSCGNVDEIKTCLGV